MLKIFEILLKGGQKVLKKQSGKTEKFESKKNSSKACDGIARANIEMRKSIDDNEQYGRKLCLRSGGVSIKDKKNRTTVYRSKKYLRKGI